MFFFNFSEKTIGFYKLSFRFFYFNSIPHVPTQIPRTPTLITRIPTPIPRISTPISCIPTPIPCIHLFPFPDSPFRLLQIAEFVRPMFQSLFEDTTVTPNFLKSQICNKSCIKTDTLSDIFNNKESRNFKVRLSHGILEGMNDG